jgi:GlpG protein
MPQMIRALSVPLEEDLLPLSALLRQRGVRHRIVEQGGEQVVEVASREEAAAVEELYRRWRCGDIDITLRRRSVSPASISPGWASAPVTLLLVVLSIAGFAVVYLLRAGDVILLLAFSPTLGGDPANLAEATAGQYWRLVTPIFLHFSWLHIVFNCLWLWELGRRVEAVLGHFNALMLCLLIAVVSNVSQFVFGGGGLFGGMSGVVYGLLGFAWVAPLLQPRWPIRPMPAVMALMVGWLVVCLVGFVEAVGFGAVANAAHVGGLVCGAALGAVLGILSRFGADRHEGGQL